MSFVGSEGVVLANAFEEFAAVLVGSEEDLAGLLPLDLVGVTLADVLAGVAKQVEQGLEDLGHLDHMIFAESHDGFMPLVPSKGRVLVAALDVDRRRLPEALNFRSLLIEEEGACHQLVTGAFLYLSFDVLLHGVLALLNDYGFLDALIEIARIEWLLGLFVVGIVLNGGDAEEHVLLQVLVLDVLPGLGEVAHCPLGKEDLILSELTVLSQCIDADDELDFLSLERLRLDVIPSAVGGEVSGVEGLIALVVPLLLSGLLKERFLFLFLLLLALADFEVVDDGGIEGLLEEAGFVLKADCHVAAEAGHLKEVHAGLADHLLHVDGAGEDLGFLLLRLKAGGHLFLCLFTFLNWGGLWVSEDVKSEALILLEDFVNQVLMSLASINILDNVGSIGVDVCAVIIIFLDGFLGRHQLADVAGS